MCPWSCIYLWNRGVRLVWFMKSRQGPFLWAGWRFMVPDSTIPYSTSSSIPLCMVWAKHSPFTQLSSPSHFMTILEISWIWQLVIMNASSFIGQLTSGVLVQHFGVSAVLTSSTFGGTVLLFALIGLRTLASVVVIGILYGYSAGICKPAYHVHCSAYSRSPLLSAVQALWAPVLVILSPDPSDLGYAPPPKSAAK